MEKTQQTPGGAPHRRRHRRGSGSGAAIQQPQREARAPREEQAERRPAQPSAPRSPRPARGPRAAQPERSAPQEAQQPQRQVRTRAAAGPAAPKREPAPRPQPQQRPVRTQRAPRPRAEEENPGLELISRRPPKQKFSDFEQYLEAHGGVTAPLPPEPAEPQVLVPEFAHLTEASDPPAGEQIPAAEAPAAPQ